MGKIFNKGLDKDDQKGLFKRLKNIENAQKGLINGNNKNKPDSARSKSSISSVFDIISSESKDEDKDQNEKTARELYQDETEGMKGLKLPGEIEIKDEKSQMYLENNLNKIKNNFSNIYDKYQRFFEYIANKKKYIIDYEILSYKVHDINFYDRYDTLYNYLTYFSKLSAGEISIKNKSFLKDLLKGFKLKSVYITKGGNNIEKAYDDSVFNDKSIDDILYKKVNNEFSNKNKNIFQEAKKLFDLRIEIYIKLFFEEKNLKFEKSIGETVKLKNQKDNLSEVPEQKEFNDFFKQIKEEHKNIDMNLFKNVFNYEMPDEMLKYLHSLKKIDNYNQKASLIEESLIDFKDEVEIMSKSDKKNKRIKILEVVDNILNFTLIERKKIGQGLNILTPTKCLVDFQLL